MSITILLGAILGTTIVVRLVHLLFEIFTNGLTDIIGTGFENFNALFGTNYSIFFISCFALVGIIYLARFIASWYGENAGHNANR